MKTLKTFISLIVFGVSALFLSACPEEEEESASSTPGCVPGESRLCHCASGQSGRQVCAQDGRSLGQCECEQATDPATTKQPNQSGVAPVGQAPPVTPPVTPPSPPIQINLPPADPPGHPAKAMAAPFIPDNATLALWHFDEGNGQIIGDLGGFGLGAKLNNTAWTKGKHGAAIAYNGANANIEVTSHAGLFPTTGITLEAWVKPESATADMRIYDFQGTHEFGLRPRGNTLEVFLTLRVQDVARTLVSTKTVSINQWHHVAGTFDGTTMRLFVDGQLYGELSSPGMLTKGITTTCKSPAIGSLCTGSSGWFHGAIDELRISKFARYVLTPTGPLPTGIAGQTGKIPTHTKTKTGTKTGTKVGEQGKKAPNLTDFARDRANEAMKILGIKGLKTQ